MLFLLLSFFLSLSLSLSLFGIHIRNTGMRLESKQGASNTTSNFCYFELQVKWHVVFPSEYLTFSLVLFLSFSERKSLSHFLLWSDFFLSLRESLSLTSSYGVISFLFVRLISSLVINLILLSLSVINFTPFPSFNILSSFLTEEFLPKKSEDSVREKEREGEREEREKLDSSIFTPHFTHQNFATM